MWVPSPQKDELKVIKCQELTERTQEGAFQDRHPRVGVAGKKTKQNWFLQCRGWESQTWT